MTFLRFLSGTGIVLLVAIPRPALFGGAESISHPEEFYFVYKPLGFFGEPEESPGLNQFITWDQLLITSGIKDDGEYTLAARASNAVGTTTRFRTLKVENTTPTIQTPPQTDAIVGEPFTIDLAATDPGADSPTRREISWGDGSDAVSLGASAVEASHIYLDDGNYNIRIFVHDEDSEPDAAAVLVHPIHAQVADIPNSGPFEIEEGQDLTLDAAPYGSPTSIGWEYNGQTIVSSEHGTLTWSQLQSLSPVPINDDGDYSLSINATYLDTNGLPYTITTPVELAVTNVAPTAIFDGTNSVIEGSDGAGVFVSFVDPFDPAAADDTFRYDFFFGDTFSQENTTSSTMPVPAALLVEDGELQVRGVIKDKDGGATEYLTKIQILEDEPDMLLVPVPTNVSEGSEFELTATVVDQGDETLEQIVVDWGDGVIETIDTLDVPIPHRFVDNGARNVKLSIWSDGIKYTQSAAVSVTNVDPSLGSFRVVDTPNYEGTPVRFTGIVNDPGDADSFVLSVNWGDGSSMTYNLPSGVSTFDLTHTYTDEGNYPVTAIVRDDDNGSSTPVGIVVEIENAAPNVGLVTNRSSILEGDEISLTGLVGDAGPSDVFDVTINWGDGSVPTLLSDVGSSFQAVHRYLDDFPTNASRDDATIEVTVVDANDGTSIGMGQTALELINIPPQLNELDGAAPRQPLGSVDLGETVSISGLFTEQGIQDVLTVEVDWGDGNITAGTLNYTSDLGGNLLASHAYLKQGDYSIAVRLHDDDGGVSNELTANLTVIDTTPLLRIDDIFMAEGDESTTIFHVPGSLSKPLDGDLYFEYIVVPGTAAASDDYVTMSGEYSIPAGETSFEFPISVIGDNVPEADETFFVNITFLNNSGSDAYAVADAKSLVTIANDDELSIVGVKVGSTEWTHSFREFIDPSEDDFGYPIPMGANQLAPLPWANINQLQLEFNADIGGSFAENLFGIGGVRTPNYQSYIDTTVYDASAFPVTMTLDTFFGDDQLLLVASDLLTTNSGFALDGEWTTGQTTANSGDGSAGGTFEFRFDVLPGDVNQSGDIRSNDGFTALKLQFQDIGEMFYLPFADIDGSGTIRSNDGFFALARQFTEETKGTPIVPPIPHAARVAAATAVFSKGDEELDAGNIDDIVDEFVDEISGRRGHEAFALPRKNA